MLLFPPSEYLQRVSEHWFLTRDGDKEALALYEQHYSCHRYKDGRIRRQFVGPGEKTVLIDAEASALFVWRKFKSGDGQQGVNCAVFRNCSKVLSSTLILEAEAVAWKRWPEHRLYTYVNSRCIQSRNPGYCFKVCGWTQCGITKWNKLLILEKEPNANR